MRNTEFICGNCVYKLKADRGYVCEKTGMHTYWNKRECPDHVETAKSYWADQKDVHEAGKPDNPKTNERRKMKVKIKLLTETAKMPYHGTSESAGWDLYADRVVEEEDRYVYYTGVAVEIPKHFCGLILPRSSVVKTGLIMGNSIGLIDRDYIGELSCVFYKRQGATPYKIGERIAQFFVSPVPDIEFVQVDELTPTSRGSGGYGSTGLL